MATTTSVSLVQPSRTTNLNNRRIPIAPKSNHQRGPTFASMTNKAGLGPSTFRQKVTSKASSLLPPSDDSVTSSSSSGSGGSSSGQGSGQTLGPKCRRKNLQGHPGAPQAAATFHHPTLGYAIPPPQPAKVARRNARERNRVKQVNCGFEQLRSHIPSAAKHKKMSKVDTLRHAVEYIQSLQRMLVQGGGGDGPAVLVGSSVTTAADETTDLSDLDLDLDSFGSEGSEVGPRPRRSRKRPSPPEQASDSPDCSTSTTVVSHRPTSPTVMSTTLPRAILNGRRNNGSSSAKAKLNNGHHHHSNVPLQQRPSRLLTPPPLTSSKPPAVSQGFQQQQQQQSDYPMTPRTPTSPSNSSVFGGSASTADSGFDSGYSNNNSGNSNSANAANGSMAPSAFFSGGGHHLQGHAPHHPHQVGQQLPPPHLGGGDHHQVNHHLGHSNNYMPGNCFTVLSPSGSPVNQQLHHLQNNQLFHQGGQFQHPHPHPHHHHHQLQHPVLGHNNHLQQQQNYAVFGPQGCGAVKAERPGSASSPSSPSVYSEHSVSTTGFPPVGSDGGCFLNSSGQQTMVGETVVPHHHQHHPHHQMQQQQQTDVAATPNAEMMLNNYLKYDDSNNFNMYTSVDSGAGGDTVSDEDELLDAIVKWQET